MSVQAILPFTRSILREVVHTGDLVVDATMGNGLDTLFLAQLVGKEGQVLAYDIQQGALEKTKARLEQENCLEQVRLLHKGHEKVTDELQDLQQPLAAAMFNLGYLPGGDKGIVTLPTTTIQALHTLREYLRPQGIITLVVYWGHPEGAVEKDALLQELSNWDQKKYSILQYRFINQQSNPPFLVAIQKK